MKCKIGKVYKMELQQENEIQSQDKIPSTSKELHCNYCTRRFTEQKNLTRHVSVVHHNVRPFSCEDCKKAFASKQELVRHSEKQKGCKFGKITKNIRKKQPVQEKDSIKILKKGRFGHRYNSRYYCTQTLTSCLKCNFRFPSKRKLELHVCSILCSKCDVFMI